MKLPISLIEEGAAQDIFTYAAYGDLYKIKAAIDKDEKVLGELLLDKKTLLHVASLSAAKTNHGSRRFMQNEQKEEEIRDACAESIQRKGP